MAQPIPREWNFAARTGGLGQSVITIPAGLAPAVGVASGIVHFIREVEYETHSIAAGAGDFTGDIQVIDLTTATVIFSWPFNLDLSAINTAHDVIAINRQTVPGGAMQIQFSAASPTVNVGQALIARGYSI